MRVCVALVLVLALAAAGGAADRRGFAPDFQRRAAAHVNAANGRAGGGSSSPRFAALAEAMNAGLPGSRGSGSGAHKHKRPAYDPGRDASLSLPALDYAPKAALTPLSMQSPLPTLRPQDLASTTLTAPWPDPIAPSAADIPHAVAPPQPRDALYAPRFRQLSGSGDSSAEGDGAAAGAAADAVNSIVSPDGGALSPLRPHEPAFDAAPPPSRRHGHSDDSEPYRHVIPIELTDEQLAAAQHPPSDADLMRFATRHRGGGDQDTPMAFTNAGPIAPYGPLARHHRFQNKRRNIFGKRVTIQLPIPGAADAQASVAARTAEWKALSHANVKGGPFDADNAEVDAEELDDEPQLTHRAPAHHSANVAAPPPRPFDAAEEADATEAVDATDAVFLQTGTVSQQRARHFGRSGGAPAVMRAGDTLLYRVDPRGRRHSSTHFRHRYRDSQASQEAAAAEADAYDAYDEGAQARAAAFVSMRERARVERERSRNAAETLSSPLELPARNAPRPHAHFPEPPLNLDSFDPFEGGRGGSKRLPNSPSRPMPPPMVRGPVRAKPNPGTLQASTFLATHAAVKRADAKGKNKAQTQAQAKGKAKAKAAEAKAAEAAKAAAKKLAEAKAKAAADAAAKKAAAAKAKAAAEKAAAAKAAAAQQAAAMQAQAQALALAQAQAAAASAAAPVDMLRLMQRLQADAGVDAAQLSTAGSAAAQLQALRRIEGAVRAAEERLALQAQVDALQAQVSGLMQLQLQRQQSQQQPQPQPAPAPAVSLMETAATAQATDAAADSEWEAEAETEATEETADAAAEAETESETEAAAESEADAESSEAEAESAAAEGEAEAGAEAEAESADASDASTAAPADAEAALAAAEAAADADAAAEVESAE